MRPTAHEHQRSERKTISRLLGETGQHAFALATADIIESMARRSDDDAEFVRSSGQGSVAHRGTRHTLFAWLHVLGSQAQLRGCPQLRGWGPDGQVVQGKASV